MPYNFGMTSGEGLGLHGPAAFTTSPILPQGISPTNYQNQTMTNGHFTTAIPAQQPHLQQFMNLNAHTPSTQPMLLNGMNGPFNYMNFVQGQPINQMPTPHSSYGMSSSSNFPITPEVNYFN
jgi:hypothetical protein